LRPLTHGDDAASPGEAAVGLVANLGGGAGKAF
jgi:hypothetical protein